MDFKFVFFENEDWRTTLKRLPGKLREIGWAIVGLVIVAAVLYVGTSGALRIAVWIWPASEFAEAMYYSGDDDLKNAAIKIYPMPHDCEFLTAPIGDKHCHYEKQVATVRIRIQSNNRQFSIDDGNSWQKAQPSDKPTVLISWQKAED